MSDVLYKALLENGMSPHQGYKWPLPTENGDGWTSGAWVEAGGGELVECGHGIHCCTIEQLPRWLDARLYVLEPAEGTDRLDGEDKTVVRRARLTRPVQTWTEKTQRLFAADCAAMVLPLYEREHPDDDRPRKAIEAARQYARGEIDDDALAAARAAARDAAWDAAWGAAWVAVWAAARDAARAAAWSAAWAAANIPGWPAAWGAARDAITTRLALYLEHGEDAADVRVETLEAEDE